MEAIIPKEADSCPLPERLWEYAGVWGKTSSAA
jgi:hypothetical protein